MPVSEKIILVCKPLPQLPNSSGQAIVPVCQLGKILLEVCQNTGNSMTGFRTGLGMVEVSCGVITAVVRIAPMFGDLGEDR